MRRARFGAAAAIAGTLALGSCVFGGGGAIKVDAIFADIGDLPRFANVQASDVKVGTVRGIRLEGYNARVTMRLDAGVEIPRNAIALVRSTSLLGEKFVDLRAPDDGAPSTEVLRDGDVIPVERTRRLPGVDDAFIKLGRMLEDGNAAALATIIHSSATIARGREEALGEIFTNLRTFSGVFAQRAPDVAAAIVDLDTTFKTLAGGSDVIKRALSSSADAVKILSGQQANLDRLVLSLDRASAVLARYSRATFSASDRALKDLRLILDEAMKTTGDLEQAVTALASFTDLWPRAIPGDYVQLDIVLTLADMGPSATSAQVAAVDARELRRLQHLAELLWRPVR